MKQQGNHTEAERSWIVEWKDNKPTLKRSHWVPGYTDAHCELPSEALAYAMAQVLNQTAKLREQWLNLTIMVEAEKTRAAARGLIGLADQVEDSMMGNRSTFAGVEVTKTPDMFEQIDDPEFAAAPRIDKKNG